MYTIKVTATFSAAHNLRGYKGKCEALHGHNWKVEVSVCREGLDRLGMVIDFTEVKKRLRAVLSECDHAYINKLECFRKVNPTSENIARYIYERLKKALPGLRCVTVWENETSQATYEE